MKKMLATAIVTVLGVAVISGASVLAADRPVRVAFEEGVSAPQFASGSGMQMRRFELPEGMSGKFGIDVEGLSDDEIKAAMEAQRSEREAEMATKKAEMLEEIKAALVEKGVNVSAMTEEEIFAAAKENGLMTFGKPVGEEFGQRPRGHMGSPEQLAASFGLELTGMTNEQKADAIAQAVKDWCLEQFDAQE